MLFYVEVLLCSLCAAVGIMAAMCGLLTEVMRKRYYIILFLITFTPGIISYLTPYGQKVTPPIIITILFIICVGTKMHKIINLCIACFGYMLDVIINQVVLYFVHLDVTDFTDVCIFSCIYTSFLVIFMLVLRKILYNKLNILNRIEDHKLNYGVLLNLLCFVAVFIANIVMGETVNYSHSVLLMNCVLFGLCFLSTSIVLLYFTRTIRSEEEKKADQARLEMTENYVSSLEQLIDESRELRHDYKNLIATISGFIEEGDMNHLKEYFDQNIRNTWVDLDKKGKAWQSVKDIQPPELKGLLYEKVLKAVAAGVNIRVIPDYELNIQYKAMKDLCRIIGILTDNAIEAAEETDDKSVDIRMMHMEYGYQIIIQNTYFTKPDLVHLYQKGYSTKGENRGLGMYYAREMILDHEELEFEFEIQDHFVIQKIYIEL